MSIYPCEAWSMSDQEWLDFEATMQDSYQRQQELVLQNNLEAYLEMQRERSLQALELDAFKARNRVGFC